MRKTTLAITIAAMAVISVSSCKKDDDNKGLSGRSAEIVGTWRETENGEDVNVNGVWDNSEKTAVDTADATTIVFNSNGSGTSSQSLGGTKFTAPTTWTLQNNDNVVRIIATIPLFGVDTLYYNIVSFSNTVAIVKDTTDTPVSYMTLTKQ